MAKIVHNNVLDAALSYISANANRLIVCDTEPTVYATTILNHDSSGWRLASKTISAGNFTGPADGVVSGRKLTVNAASSMAIDGFAAGANNATYVALVKQGASGFVVYATTCTSQSLTAGNKVNTPAWVIELRDPA